MPLRSPDIITASDEFTQSPSSTSLERRLPLMISGLLPATIAAFGFIAFTEVRQSSLAAANGLLSAIVSQTAGTLTTTLRSRANALMTYSRNPLVVRAVSASSTRAERDAAAQFLIARRTRNDTATLRAQLLIDSKGDRMLAVGTSPEEHDLQMLERTFSAASDTRHVSIGSPYAKDSSMWYWSTTSVSPGDAAMGDLAELRRIRASPNNVDQTLKGFTGQDISLYGPSCCCSGCWERGG